MTIGNNWINKYIGIPFIVHGRSMLGADCYGLVKLVLAQERAIFLPDYVDDYAEITEYKEIAGALSREALAESGPWKLVPRGEERSFDVMVANMMGFPMHCGIVAYKNHILHLIQGADAVCENYTRGTWASKDRIVGFFRHESLV